MVSLQNYGFVRTLGLTKEVQRGAFKLIGLKRDSLEYTICWRSSKFLNTPLKLKEIPRLKFLNGLCCFVDRLCYMCTCVNRV